MHLDDVRHYPGSHRGDLLGLNGPDSLGHGGDRLHRDLLRGQARRRLHRHRLLGSLDYAMAESAENPQHEYDDCGDGKRHAEQGRKPFAARLRGLSGRGLTLRIFRSHKVLSVNATVSGRAGPSTSGRRYFGRSRSASKTGSASPITFVARAKRTMCKVSRIFAAGMPCILALFAIAWMQAALPAASADAR